MNIDPRCSTDYLDVGLDDDRVAASILGKLGAVPDDRTDALDLHLLRAMNTRAWGDAEGAVFERIATDDTRRPPVRAWAVQALRRTPRWKERAAMEATIAEPDPIVRRAILVGMRGNRARRRGNFLRHVRERFPELQLTARWIEAA